MQTLYALASKNSFTEWKECYTRIVITADSTGKFQPLFLTEEAANEYLKLKSNVLHTGEFVVKLEVLGGDEDFSCRSCSAKVEAEHRYCWRCGRSLGD